MPTRPAGILKSGKATSTHGYLGPDQSYAEDNDAFVLLARNVETVRGRPDRDIVWGEGRSARAGVIVWAGRAAHNCESGRCDHGDSTGWCEFHEVAEAHAGASSTVRVCCAACASRPQ